MTRRILDRFAPRPGRGSSTPIRNGWERLIPLALLSETTQPLARQTSIVSALTRALRAERARGRNHHPTYDLARHAALVTALREEKRRLLAMTRAGARTVTASTAGRFRSTDNK